VVLVFLCGLMAAVSLTPYLTILPSLLNEQSSLRAFRLGRTAMDDVNLLLRFPVTLYEYVWVLLVVGLAAGVIWGWMPRGSRSAASSGNGSVERWLERWLFSGATLLVAVVGFAAFLKWVNLPTQVWYFLPLFGLAAACVEVGWPDLTRRWKVVCYGLALGSGLIGFPVAWSDLQYRFTKIDLIAKHLNAVVSPRDFVLVSPWYCGISFGRYYHSSAEWDTIPPLSDHSRHRFDLVREQMRMSGAMWPVFEKISATLQSGSRVWLIGKMDIPKPGTPSFTDLRPPPLKYSGWSDTPYNMVWDSQVAHFLRDHSTRFEIVPVATNLCVDFRENPMLFVIEGWQTNILSPPPKILRLR
jgi:hypothetical protein